MTLLSESLLRDLELDISVTAAGDLDSVSGKNNLQKALLRRLTTSKGSFVLLPNYGAGIKDYQNAPMTLDTKRRLALIIKEQFERDSRVQSVNTVSVIESTEEGGQITVKTKITVAGSGDEEFIFEPVGEIE